MTAIADIPVGAPGRPLAEEHLEGHALTRAGVAAVNGHLDDALDSLPLGVVGQQQGPATTIDATAAVLVLMSVTVNVVAGRWYRIVVWINTTMLAGAVNARVQFIPGTFGNSWIMAENGIPQGHIRLQAGIGFWRATETGPQTFQVGGNTLGGTIRFAANNSLLTIEDCGKGPS